MTADWLVQVKKVVRRHRARTAAALVALLAGLVVFVLANELFPYHSSNHDEAVYLQQANLLLHGQLELHAGDLAGVVRPWFFVQDGGTLYPKYAPVPAAMYAVSMGLVGEPRLTLAAVATGNVALVYVLGAETFDRPVGLAACLTFAAAPLALLTSAVFLPYAPTTLLNLTFAVAYVRSVQQSSSRWAGIAGLAVGLASFARPYTAVLFATPFVGHALWSVSRSVRDSGFRPLPDSIRRQALTAAGGLGFVALTLSYNAYLTGEPLLFPFEAFAPKDGLGFGQRRILGHSVDYTPTLALEANAYVLWYFATRWVTAGPVGTLAALAGLAVAGSRWRDGTADRFPGVVLAGLFVTIPLGNLFFWGNYNVLGTLADPTDGLVAQFGPFYHFDLLVPVSIFAGFATVTAWRWLHGLRDNWQLRGPRADALRRAVPAVALAVSLVLAGGVTAALLADPVDRNAAHTEKYEQAYAPLEDDPPTDAVVFLPTPYGDWLNHPFQPLRNDADLAGPRVYAMDNGSANFAVLDAYPERTYYRYRYRGEWTPDPEIRVHPKLDRLQVERGERHEARTTVGVPVGVEHATIRLESDTGDQTVETVTQPTDELVVNWTVTPEGVRLGTGSDAAEVVALGERDEVTLQIRLTQYAGSTLTYRQELSVRQDGDTVELIWPPERTVCPLVDDCGNRGTYLPEHPKEHRDGVAFETNLTDGQ